MSNFNVLFTLSNAQMLLSKTLKSRECNSDVHSSDNKQLLPLLNHSIYFSPLWWQNMIILIIIPEDLFGICPPIYRLLLEMSRFDKWWFWNGFVWASRTNRGATWTPGESLRRWMCWRASGDSGCNHNRKRQAGIRQGRPPRCSTCTECLHLLPVWDSYLGRHTVTNKGGDAWPNICSTRPEPLCVITAVCFLFFFVFSSFFFFYLSSLTQYDSSSVF